MGPLSKSKLVSAVFIAGGLYTGTIGISHLTKEDPNEGIHQLVDQRLEQTKTSVDGFVKPKKLNDDDVAGMMLLLIGSILCYAGSKGFYTET